KICPFGLPRSTNLSIPATSTTPAVASHDRHPSKGSRGANRRRVSSDTGTGSGLASGTSALVITAEFVPGTRWHGCEPLSCRNGADVIGADGDVNPPIRRAVVRGRGAVDASLGDRALSHCRL